MTRDIDAEIEAILDRNLAALKRRLAIQRAGDTGPSVAMERKLRIRS